MKPPGEYPPFVSSMWMRSEDLRDEFPGCDRPGCRQSKSREHYMRNGVHLAVKFKDLTPVDKLAEIHARNLERYGDKLGPSIDWLRKAGKSWDDIIESATRSGGKDLGL